MLEHPILTHRAIRLRNNQYFPCRHIYQGGDDLTFVCDARIALALTAFLARELEEPLKSPDDEPDKYKEVPEAFQRLTVSIGVVCVDSHFPFSRAKYLAEDTRQNAKRRALETNEDNPPSTIDWWVNRQGALVRPHSSFKGASYKPYLLHGRSGRSDVLSWEQLETMLLGRGNLQNQLETMLPGPRKPQNENSVPGMWTTFRDARGKLKDVLAAAESGSAAKGVRRLLQLRPLKHAQQGKTESLSFVKLPAIDVDAETGFRGDSTPLLDAGELYDIHFPFRNPDETEG